MGPEQKVIFEEEQVTLEIATERVVLGNGWTITPHTYPAVSQQYIPVDRTHIFNYQSAALPCIQITKGQVDQFAPSCGVPSCHLYVKWTGKCEEPEELVHKVKLLGAKEPFNFFFIKLPPFQQPLQG